MCKLNSQKVDVLRIGMRDEQNLIVLLLECIEDNLPRVDLLHDQSLKNKSIFNKLRKKRSANPSFLAAQEKKDFLYIHDLVSQIMLSDPDIVIINKNGYRKFYVRIPDPDIRRFPTIRQPYCRSEMAVRINILIKPGAK